MIGGDKKKPATADDLDKVRLPWSSLRANALASQRTSPRHGGLFSHLFYELLQDLDTYFSRDPEKAKANLDDDLDSFMKQRDATPSAAQ